MKNTLETVKLGKDRSNGNATGTAIALPEMNIKTVQIRLESISPLMVLRFSEKARNTMLAKQTGEAKAGRER